MIKIIVTVKDGEGDRELEFTPDQAYEIYTELKSIFSKGSSQSNIAEQQLRGLAGCGGQAALMGGVI